MHETFSIAYPTPIGERCNLSNINLILKSAISLQNALNKVLKEISLFRSEIVDSSSKLKKYLFDETAKEVDIHRLDKYDKRIRCRDLINKGIETVYDLFHFGYVSDERTKAVMQSIVKDISTYNIPAICPDKKNVYSSNVVHGVVNLTNFKQFESIASSGVNTLSVLLFKFKTLKRRWLSILTLFSKKRRKQLSVEYFQLISNYEKTFKTMMKTIINPFNKVTYFAIDEAWTELLKHKDLYSPLLDYYKLKVLYSFEVETFPLARNISISSEQIEYISLMMDKHMFSKEEKYEFHCRVKNQYILNEENPNFHVSSSFLKKIHIDPYKAVYSFKCKDIDLFKYVLQVFIHSTLPIETYGNTYMGVVDIRSLEYGYLDWLRRLYRSEMHSIHEKYSHIDSMFNWMAPPNKTKNKYLDEVCNHDNGWETDASIYDEILKFHATINTELFISGKKNFRFKGEGDLFKMVHDKFPDALFQFRAVWLDRLSLDMFIPSLNIAIEYQGEQHYRPINESKKQIALFEEQKERDAKKQGLCRKKGIVLLQWKYDVEVNTTEFQKFLKDNFIG